MPPGTRPNTRFCSAQCRGKARYLKHREEFSERSRERYRQLKAQKPQTAACKYCGKEFIKTDGRQIYCSVTCKRRMDNARARERKGLPPTQLKVGAEVTCPVCGKPFLYDSFGAKKYCSKECSAKAQKEHKRRWEQLNRNAAADKPPEPKPEPKPAPTECRTWVFGKEAINFGVPQYACLKPVKPPPPPPPPPPQKPEWRPWILENRPPNQADMEMMLDKIFAKEATNENN